MPLLLKYNKQDDLKRLYKLYSRVSQGLIPIGNILKTHIQKEGMELVREQQARLNTKAPNARQRSLSP